MTKEELFKFHQELCEKGFGLMESKNHDYSKGHPLGNFLVCESMQICSAENGILVRLSDKMSRLASVIEKGTKVSESVEDTLVDIINYTVLLGAVIRYKDETKIELSPT